MEIVGVIIKTILLGRAASVEKPFLKIVCFCH